MSDLAERKMQFLFTLRSKGISNARVLAAMEKVDRGMFVRGHFADRAYEDMPLPIASGQTISQPSVVGLMTQALEVSERDKVLEIGTGSGYQAAVLSHLARRVASGAPCLYDRPTSQPDPCRARGDHGAWYSQCHCCDRGRLFWDGGTSPV